MKSTTVPIDSPAPRKRRPGAPPGNRNAVRHGLYSRKRAGACRRALSESGYAGADLEIALALWQAAVVFGSVPDRELLHLAALRRVFALVRRKYGLPRRGDDDPLSVIFIRLCYDFVFTPAVGKRLAAALAAR